MRAERGFSLVETLAAFAIASAALIAIAQIYAAGFRNEVRLTHRLEAARRAESLLAEFEALEILQPSMSGRFDRGYHWRAEFQPIGNAAADPTQYWWVRIEVTPSSDGGRAFAPVVIESLLVKRELQNP